MNENETVDQKYYISVIGVDNRIHKALPWETTCECGCKILNKKPTKKDIENHFSCYMCTY